MRRTPISLLVAVLALIGAACTAAAAPTSTAAPTTTAAPPPTQPEGRVILSANGPAFIHEGDRGPYVAALQHYLVCTGHGQPSQEGGSVSIDGVFGPITADAVAFYQAELRRIPTGEPDEETFASLARDCREPQSVAFEIGTTSTEVAGNVAAGDEEVFVMLGRAGQVLSIRPTEGLVTVTAVGADGTIVDGESPEGPFEAELTTDQEYRIRVAAEATTSFRMTLSTRSPNVIASDFGPMVLAPDGLGIADIGDDPDNTMAVIALVLGPPFVDTDWQSGVPGCTGTNRHLTWIIQAGDDGENHPAVLTVDFADLGGTPFFAQYAYRSFDLTVLDPIAQGLTTAEGITLGSSLEEFEEAYGSADFFDELRGLTTFEERMLAGFVIGDDPADRQAWYVGAGDDGCEDFG